MAPPYVSSIRQQIARAGLEKHVTLLGAIPNGDVATYLARCHALVVPSFYEAFGIVYLEAMSWGLPVIASTAGAAHELITPDDTGFLIAPGDADTLAHHLRTWHGDREMLLHMGLAAQQRALAHPTWAESVGRIRGLLQTLVT